MKANRSEFYGRTIFKWWVLAAEGSCWRWVRASLWVYLVEGGGGIGGGGLEKRIGPYTKNGRKCAQRGPIFYQEYVNGIKLNVAIIVIMHDTNNNAVNWHRAASKITE